MEAQKQSDCLYDLPEDRYQRLVKYYKGKGQEACCHCRKCHYQILRVAAKGMVPLIEYDSGRFQANLKASKTNDFFEIIYLSPGQIEALMKDLWES